MKKWPIVRRAGRAIGLFRVEAEELHMENDTLAALHKWSADNRVSHTLLTVLYSNTTEMRAGLNKLASTQFSADARF